MQFEYAMGILLIRGGCVLTQDAALGDFECADILIDQDRMVALAPQIQTVRAEVIDASGMIVMPGGLPLTVRRNPGAAAIDAARALRLGRTTRRAGHPIGIDLERVRRQVRASRDAVFAASGAPVGCRPH